MSHTRTYNKVDPANGDKAGKGAEEIRDLKEDIEERMKLDHYWTSSVDTTIDSADGYHKKLTIKSGSAPTALSDAGILYSKDVSGKAELFYKDDAGTEYQITSRGKYSFYGNYGKSLVVVESGVEAIDSNNEYISGTFTPENTGHYFVEFTDTVGNRGTLPTDRTTPFTGGGVTNIAAIDVTVNGSADSVYGGRIFLFNAGDVVTFGDDTFSVLRVK